MVEFHSYEEWIAQVPDSLQADPLWGFETYRTALFLADLAWFDCEKLMADSRGKAIASQLIRSAGSVPANIEEGYGYSLVDLSFLRRQESNLVDGEDGFPARE